MLGYTYFIGIFVLGVILLLLEIFIPGFGVFGILGVLMIFASIIIASGSIVNSIYYCIIAAIVILVLGYFALKNIKQKKLNSHLFLDSKLEKDDGFVSSKDMKNYLHKQGCTISYLRPFGKIDIEGEVLDATTENAFIQKNTKVKVVRVEGNKIIVKEMKGE